MEVRQHDPDATGLCAQASLTHGFAGFRVMDPTPAKTDWLAFQGASYFRTSGVQGQYGLSARDILVELGRKKMVGGQEDMIEDTAMTMARERDARMQKKAA